MLQVRTTASLANTPAYARVSSQALKSGSSWRVIPSRVKEGFAQEEKVERHWMAMQSQLLHDLERGVQWIASALRQRNPDDFRLLSSSRVRTSGDGSFAGDAVKTECDERGAESRPAWLQSRSTSVSGACFCVCAMRLP